MKKVLMAVVLLTGVSAFDTSAYARLRGRKACITISNSRGKRTYCGKHRSYKKYSRDKRRIERLVEIMNATRERCKSSSGRCHRKKIIRRSDRR